MRKNLLNYLFVALCSVPLFTSCSDDDDNNDNFVVCPVGDMVFTAANGLNLTYNGEPMIGKQVHFIPETYGTKARIILEGEPIDWNSLMGRSELSVPQAPGVLPGSASVTLDVDLTIEGEECSFSGVSETNYCTFNYEGKLSSGAMDLALTHVELKNTALAATTWKLRPYNEEDYTDSPVHVVWESEKRVELFEGFEMPIESILLLALSMPMIEEGDNVVSAAQKLGDVLQDVTFRADGNIVATYKDAANGSTAWETSPLNLVQYVVEAGGQMRVFLNPQAIMAAAARAARVARENNAGGIDGVMQQALIALQTLVVEGVPLAYTQEGDNLSVFLDENVLLPLLQGIVIPFLQDEELINVILEEIASDPDFASMSGMVVGALQSLPEVINTTTKLEIGLNLVKAQ